MLMPKRQGPEMVIENRDGIETYYEAFGDPEGEAIVLLHGLGADHAMWEPQIETFAEAGYQVVAPDLLGHGRSSSVERLTLEDWEVQVEDLLEERGIHHCILVGVSMGGVIAQAYEVHRPEKVDRLILCDTFAELGTVSERARGFVQVMGFRLVKLVGPRMLGRLMASAYSAPFAQQARQYFTEVSADADLDQLILARKAINRVDLLDEMRGVDVPALVLVGDGFGEWFTEINRQVADAIEGARFVVLERALDPSNLVNPVGFNREVLAFLEGGSH